MLCKFYRARHRQIITPAFEEIPVKTFPSLHNHYDAELKNKLRQALSCAVCEWFEPLNFRRLSTAEGESIEIALPHAFYLGWLEQHGKSALEQAIAALLGAQTRIIYTPDMQKLNSPQHGASPSTFLLPDFSTEHVEARIFQPVLPDASTMHFDAFLSSGKNQFIYSFLKEAAEHGVPYNPLFLKGNSGTGKTHLLRAVATKLALRLTPPLGSSRVILLSAADFASLFPNALPDRSAASRALLRSGEAFCLDDVHTLADLPHVQDELIALLDFFLDRGKPVMVTFSGSAPSSTSSPVSSYHHRSAGLLGRIFPPLLARLSSGMTLELSEPDLDVRIRYAQAQLEENGLRPNKENAMFLARRCPSLRHLRGAVLRMAAFHAHTGQLPDETDMDSILTSTGNPHTLTPEAVITLVASHCGYAARDLRGKKRDPRLVQARQIAMFLCRELLGESYPSLGRLFGGKDHSTVMHSVKKIRENQVTNKDVHILVTELTQRCQNYLFQS